MKLYSLSIVAVVLHQSFEKFKALSICMSFAKRLVYLLAIFGLASPVLAQQVIWRGEPVEKDEILLSGSLTIKLENGLAKGNIAGLKAQAKIDSQRRFELSFKPKGSKQLAAGTGIFKGYFVDKNQLRGHWIRPNMQKRASVSYASPVHFSRKGDKYSGVVIPLEDKLTVYFVTENKAPGRFGLNVFVPENNAGRFYTNTDLIIAKGKATLVRVSDDGEEELVTGPYDSGSDSFRLSFPSWGGEIRFHKQAGDPRELLGGNSNKPYIIPKKQNDGWPVGNADDFRIDSKALQNFANGLNANPASTAFQAQNEAFLLAKNGVLIFESYFRGYDPKQPHDLRSASKSLTGIMPGLVEQASGNNQSSLLRQPIYKTLGYAADNPKKQLITLEHALSMSTGLDCDDWQNQSPGNEDTMQNQTAEQDWFRYILDLDLVHEPGKHLAYCSGGINLTGAILNADTGRWMPSLIEDLFARPLGIKHYQINLVPDGQQAYSGGGLHLRARDFLKLGQLMLNKGRWQEHQLLNPVYVANALASHGSISGDEYGLGWWLRRYEVEGRSYDVFYAGGNGGQQIIAVPELNMVAVFFGSAYSTRGSRTARDDWFPNIILKNAVVDNDR